ncbi:MAG TPA: CrcB family protein [Polyangiaceae bacterium]|nr:CrcB family protein [Polyangiaceae bacterium]
MPLFWQRLACVALGGALGSCLRWLVSEWAAVRWGTGYPVGTTIVNLVGSFVFGVLWASGGPSGLSPLMRALLLSGVLGGFTTFSSFMFDTTYLQAAGRSGLALTNLALQNVVGLLLMVVGSGLGRALSAS